VTVWRDVPGFEYVDDLVREAFQVSDFGQAGSDPNGSPDSGPDRG
jgi:hypothetical protein